MSADFIVAVKAVREAAELCDEFSTDDVWPLLDVVPTERNVVGKAFSYLNDQGEIVGTERFIRSTRPEAKGRRVQVWRSARKPTLFP